MLIAGSDDGVYRVSGLLDDGDTTAEKLLDSGPVMRLRQFESADGLFAATDSGLYHSPDGEVWPDLGVPREKVYAVAVAPSGDRLYAGTRPAGVFVSGSAGPVGNGDGEWRELEGLHELPSREEWRLPRHEDLAQVRSLCVHPDAPDRIVAGVEVGGVNVSEDRGETWTERKGAVHDDVHHLHVPERDTFVAATGFGLYRSTDAGRSWTRLDTGDDRRYVREAFTHDGVIYAGASLSSSSSWNEEDPHALFECPVGETTEAVDYPVPEEVPVGFCAAAGHVVAVGHRGTLLVRRGGEWERAGEVPTPGEVTGRYLPLTWRG